MNGLESAQIELIKVHASTKSKKLARTKYTYIYIKMSIHLLDSSTIIIHTYIRRLMNKNINPGSQRKAEKYNTYLKTLCIAQ